MSTYGEASELYLLICIQWYKVEKTFPVINFRTFWIHFGREVKQNNDFIQSLIIQIEKEGYFWLVKGGKDVLHRSVMVVLIQTLAQHVSGLEIVGNEENIIKRISLHTIFFFSFP